MGARKAKGQPAGNDAPSRADLERVRAALGRSKVDWTEPLFAPDSVTWRVNREAVLLLGGGRALLLQVAHPLVAAGVARYSNFRSDPLQRLRRTLELTLTVTFGTAAQAIAAVRAIERRHRRVRGKLSDSVGPFARGTPYDANDPQLLFWVHATLVDTALLVYERFFAELGRGERERYYEESQITARMFGIVPELIPPTLSHFDDYMNDMFRSDRLSVGSAGREIARSILSPPLPIGLKQAVQSTNLFTIGLLPPRVREHYGLRWGYERELVLRAIASATRPLLPRVPLWLRSFPQAHAA